MNEKLYYEIYGNMEKICEVFSVLEFAYANYDGSENANNALSIIGVCTRSGMAASEKLRIAMDTIGKVAAK